MPKHYPVINKKHRKKTFAACPSHLQQYAPPAYAPTLPRGIVKVNQRREQRQRDGLEDHTDAFDNLFNDTSEMHEAPAETKADTAPSPVSRHTRSQDGFDKKNNRLSALHTEHYFLSKAAYEPGAYEQQLANLGWHELDHTKTDRTMHAYMKDADKSIIFANSGTVPTNPVDLTTDAVAWGYGKFAEDARVLYDMDKALAIMNDHKDYNFSATGHSLGGAMAANMGYTFNIPFTGFNPGAPVVSTGRLEQHFHDTISDAADVHKVSDVDIRENGTLYHYGHDPLSSKYKETYAGATHVDVKSHHWRFASHKDHSLDNFDRTLDKATNDTANSAVSASNIGDTD